MKLGACTHKGRVRKLNEDSFYVTNNHIKLFAVADGMGGHNAGEVASHMAIKSIVEYINGRKDTIYSEIEIVDLLKEAVEYANKNVYNEAVVNDSYKGMGTTLTVALFDEKIYMAHVGDSRAYIIRNEEINQITQDHSLVGELIRSGSITEEEGKVHPRRNMITRAIGTDENVKIDIYTSEMKKDDILVLCTDGLSNFIEDWEIKNAILSNDNIEVSCDELIGMANERGGLDNITIVATQI